MTFPYVELHTHSNFSLKEGASHIHELATQAQKLGYPALGLTDHNTLAGAMLFTQTAQSLGIQPILGSEITLSNGHHLTLIVRTQKGYENLSHLLSMAHISSDRKNPLLSPKSIPDFAEGLTLLTGCRKGEISTFLAKGHESRALHAVTQYLDWFGSKNVYIEMQQNYVYGDTLRNIQLAALAQQAKVPIVATNNVHYHTKNRHRLQDILVAISHNKTLSETHQERRANAEFYMKSPKEMSSLFHQFPDALKNTLEIANRCDFDLTRDLNYRFPNYSVPTGYTPQTYLEKLCYKAAQRRYGEITPEVRRRLEREFQLIKKHGLAGFLLVYHDIIQEARQVMIDLKLSNPEIPLEERPPGRGRGSSVALLVGYLIGLSHVDPLAFNLKLDRFLSEEMSSVPDIDLDFPREIRTPLIERIHQKWGWEHAALTGMVVTYRTRSTIRALAKALGLPSKQISTFTKHMRQVDIKEITTEINTHPELKHLSNVPVWQHLGELAGQLHGFPHEIAQHPGGMIISSTPLSKIVPIRKGAFEGRFVMEWDKEAIKDAGFIKIDFLALGTLSQMQEALQLIENRTGYYIDLSRINFEDKNVYEMLHRADTIGIFQVESAAQMQAIIRIKPENLFDMALEVAAIRPGVGIHDGITHFIRRRMKSEQWKYDHPLEKGPLARTLGIILYQDQVNELAMSIGGFSGADAEQMRRAFHKREKDLLLSTWRKKFIDGAMGKGVSQDIALKIFKKFNGQYMFPESHAFAFGVTAYQMAWIKHYYPLEFYVSIFNQQPMGFWSLETLKEDARRHGISILNLDVNRSGEKATIYNESLLLGFLHVYKIGKSNTNRILKARNSNGSFVSVSDFVKRTGLQTDALYNLADAGGLDYFGTSRRQIKWEIGLTYQSTPHQAPLDLPTEQDLIELPQQSSLEKMQREYHTTGIYPKGHLLSEIRPYLSRDILSSHNLNKQRHAANVKVAGIVVRRQKPRGKTVFITLEDEFGLIPLVVWEDTYAILKDILNAPLLIVSGKISRREGTLNIIVERARALPDSEYLPQTRNWL